MTLSSFARGASRRVLVWAGARSGLRIARPEPERTGFVWIGGNRLATVAGLGRVVEEEFEVHCGQEPPEGGVLSSVVLCVDGAEDLSEGVRRVQESSPDVPVLVYGPRADLALAWDALRAGARGFVHAGMASDRVVRALKVALEGEIAAPRGLLEYLLLGEASPNLDLLSPRQREILELVAHGLSNGQIARRVFLSESTVKQHLRSAYKILGASNRLEAARLIRNGKR